MEAVGPRHVSLPTEKRAKNRDEIVRDKAGGEVGGKRKNRSGRQTEINGGETSHVDFTEEETSVWIASKILSSFFKNRWL